MSDTESSDSLRRESETELISTDDDVRGAGPALPRLRTIRRFRRTLSILGIVAVAAASATVGSVSTRGADVRGRTSAERGETLLHLVGGAGAVNSDPAETTYNAAPATVRFTVRNDGPLPVTIVSSELRQAGIRVIRADSGVIANPGAQVIIMVDVTVDCTDPRLPSQPDALRLTVRTRDGRVHQTALDVPPIPTPTAALHLQMLYQGGMTPTNYAVLCGDVGNHPQPEVQYLGVRPATDSATFSFRVDITITSDSPQKIAAKSSAVPGITETTDLTGPRKVLPGVKATVTVTVAITDCAAVEKYLANFQGYGAIDVAQRLGDFILTVDQADPRFPSIPQSVEVTSVSGSEDFYPDVLRQLVTVCPALR